MRRSSLAHSAAVVVVGGREKGARAETMLMLTVRLIWGYRWVVRKHLRETDHEKDESER